MTDEIINKSGITDAGLSDYDAADSPEVLNDNLDFDAILAGLNDSEQEVLDTEEDEGKAIALNDADLLPEERLEDDAWAGFPVFDIDRVSGRAVLKDIKMVSAKDKVEQLTNARKEFKATYKQLKIEYARQAMNQNILDLSLAIPKAQLRQLVTLLTEPYRKRRDKNADFANKSIASLLIARMPRCIKNSFRYHPQTIHLCPGFLYQASEEYGESKTFWATPDIPYFHRQGTEMDYLMTNYGHCLYYIDKAVLRWHKASEKLDYKEVRYASILAQQLQKGTYLELLQYNAVWFHRLFVEIEKELTENGTETAENTGL